MVRSSGQTVLTRDDRGLAAGRRAPVGRSERRHRPLVAAAGVCPRRTCRPQPRVPDGAAPRPAGDGGVGCRRRRRQGRPWAGFPCDTANEHTPAARACTACWGRGGEARGRAVTAACSLQAPRGLCPAPVPRITSGLYPARSCCARGGRGLSFGWNRAATLGPGQPRPGAAWPRARGPGADPERGTAAPRRAHIPPSVRLSFPSRSPAARPRSHPARHARPGPHHRPPGPPSGSLPTSPCATGGTDVGGRTLSEGNPAGAVGRESGGTSSPPRHAGPLLPATP